MAYAIAAGDIIECQVRGTLWGSTVINTFHYRAITTSADAQVTLAAALVTFETRVWNVLRTLQSNNLENVTLSIQKVYPTRYQVITLTPANTGGNIAQVANPAGVAVVVRRRSELAGRSHRGRIYVPALPTTDTLGGNVAPLAYIAWSTAATSFMLATIDDELSATLGVPVIWSYSDPGNFDVVFSTQVDFLLRYQRRRETDKGV